MLNIEPESPNGSLSTNTATKQPHPGTERLRPFRFKKGDPRINRNGRPKPFDAYQKMIQGIGEEQLTLPDGKKITVAEAVVRTWVKSKNPMLHRLFAEYCFGKPPDKIEATGLEHKSTVVVHYGNARPDVFSESRS